MRWDNPGILNICVCADCEPCARCHVNFMPLPSRSTSAGRPAALDTALFPVLHGLLESAKGIAVRCLCLGDFFPHESGLRSGATLASMSLHPTRSASPQAFLLNRPYPAFRIGVQIRTSGRQDKGLHATCFDHLTKRGTVFAVAIMP